MISRQIAQRFSPAAATLVFLTGLLGITVGFVSIGFAGAFASRSVTYLLVILLGFAVFVPIINRFIHRSLDLAEPGIWFALFYFAHFGVRAIWDLAFGSPFLGFGPGAKDLGLINAALGVSILGFLSFWFGYQRRIGRAIAHSLPSLPRRWNSKLVVPIALLCAVVGWGTRLFLIVSQAGSIGAWIAANKDVLLRLVEGVTYLRIISSLTTVALLLFFITARVSRRRSYWLPFWLLVIPELIFEFVGGKRSGVLFLLLELLVAYYMTSERGHRISLRLARLGIVFLLFAVLLFPIISAVRFHGVGGIGQAFFASTLSPVALFRSIGYRLHDLDSLALIMDRVPVQVPHTLGSELGLLAISWIPRKIWSEKPMISLGEIFRKELVPPGLYPEGTSVSVSLPGEFYWDLGIVGVLVGMMLVGILWRFLHEYLVRPRGNLSNMLVVSAIFTSFFAPLEQSLIALFTAHFFKFLVLLLVVFAVSRTGGRSLGGSV